MLSLLRTVLQNYMTLCVKMNKHHHLQNTVLDFVSTKSDVYSLISVVIFN